MASIFKNAQNLKAKGAVEDTSNTAKIDLYKDPRMGTDQMPQDTIITCKHFLDAVEDEKYGWRWVCPGGGNDCPYRHMLPEGYVLMTKKERTANQVAADRAAAED